VRHYRRLRPPAWLPALLYEGARTALVWGGLWLLWWSDSHPLAPTTQATFFLAIWAAIEAISAIIGDAAAFIAISLEGVVVYLASALSWLAAHVAAILLSTGAVFARVWDAFRVVWSDVIKPALIFIDHQVLRFYTWLRTTLQPVFDFLARVREELQAIYRRFVQPIIDTIEFIRAINRVLLTFHIKLLQQLDAVLSQLEQRIEEPFLWINRKLNEIWNILDLVVTLDGFIQRYTLLRSMSRYAPAWMNGFWNGQIDRNRRAGDDYARGRIYPRDEVWAPGKELGLFYGGKGSRIDSAVAELVPIWRQAAGVDPPGPEEG
jgi:hypothetical protein